MESKQTGSLNAILTNKKDALHALETGLFVYVLRDSSSLLLIASNLLVILLAVGEHWNLITVLFAYLAQSVLIGCFTVLKILTFKDFTTEGLMINGKPVGTDIRAKWAAAWVFTATYGFFHAVYAVFVFAFAHELLNIGIEWRDVAIGSAIFTANHLYSFIRNKEEEKKTDLGTLMFFPFLRILPMHITIIFGGAILMFTGWSAPVLVIFLLLKTMADLAMHLIEHLPEVTKSVEAELPEGSLVS